MDPASLSTNSNSEHDGKFREYKDEEIGLQGHVQRPAL